MSEWKVTASHRSRAALIYVRQSTLMQVERNRESTARQYDLVSRARQLGWPRSAVTVIDADLGVSGASAAGRSGFAQLAAQVGMGQVGIVLSLECSRLARNNADWYRLLELAGMTDTLIADADGVYHPALFDDRLVLGMKGTMSEMELHILRARLDGGIRNKALLRASREHSRPSTIPALPIDTSATSVSQAPARSSSRCQAAFCSAYGFMPRRAAPPLTGAASAAVGSA